MTAAFEGRDEAFPALAAALDPVAVRRGMREAGALADDVRVVDLRYRPGRRCVLQYAVREAGASAEVVYSGPMTASGQESSRPRRRRGVEPDLELRDLSLSLYRFPADAELPAAPRAMDCVAVEDAIVAAGAEPAELRAARVLAYRPGLRLTVGYETSDGLALIGKLTRRRRAGRLDADAKAIEAAAGGALRLLLPVLSLPDWPMLLYPKVDGSPLHAMLAGGGALPAAPALAAALATLHSTELELEGQRSLADQAARVRGHAATLATVLPGLAARVGRLGERLSAAIEGAASSAGTIHGDLHDENVFLDGDAITLIDPEDAASGDPAIDVARLLGSLRKRALLEPGLAADAVAFSSAFIEAYSARRGVDEGLLAAMEAGFLLKSAVHCFEIQRPAWPADAERLLDAAERIGDGPR